MNNIAILCSGGDVSGMNASIKRFVEYAYDNSLVPYFIYDGYEGLIDNKIKKATYKDVSGIINRGGTILGSSRSKRFMEQKYRDIAKENLIKLQIDKLVVLGGDGSFKGMEIFYKESGIKFCAIPSTIDNDINGTDYSLGVDTALNIIKDAIDNIRDTASSFSRAFVIETMGRNCGYLALISALTSGAELCLIPEIPYELNRYKNDFIAQMKSGRKYFIAIISEGIKDSSEDITKWFKDEIGIEARATILGHIQRGGNPSTYDRLMAYKFTTYAVDGLLSSHTNSAICYNSGGFEYKSIDEIVSKKFELNAELIRFAKNV